MLEAGAYARKRNVDSWDQCSMPSHETLVFVAQRSKIERTRCQCEPHKRQRVLLSCVLFGKINVPMHECQQRVSQTMM
jgi:hypothetical protein